MMKAKVFSAFLVIVLPTGMQAQPDSAAARVSAGLVLADWAVSTENAPLLLTALEIVSAHAPKGETATKLQNRYQAEARFLMRGDKELGERFDRLISNTSPESLRNTVWIVPGGSRFAPPQGQGVASFASATGVSARQVFGLSGASCRREAQNWNCVPADLQGEIHINHVPGGPDWVVIETRPVEP